MGYTEFNKQTEPSLGRGIFTLAEVARYTHLHPTTVRSWFKGRSDKKGRGPIFRSDFSRVGGTYSVSFLDLVDVLVAAQFRGLGVRMNVVRAAHDRLQESRNQRHPFCHQDLYTDGKSVITLAAGGIGSRILSDVLSGQQLFLEIKKHLDHIDYSAANSLAERWCIAKGIVIDPAISRGKPCIAGTGITTFVINNAYIANSRDAAFVADIYDLNSQDVLNAVDFERTIGHAA